MGFAWVDIQLVKLLTSIQILFLSVCRQSCRSPKYLFLTMTKCKWPTQYSALHLSSSCTWNTLGYVAKENFTVCWLKPGVCPQMSCCTSSCKGKNSFPQGSAMFNSCGFAAKVWFNNFGSCSRIFGRYRGVNYESKHPFASRRWCWH